MGNTTRVWNRSPSVATNLNTLADALAQQMAALLRGARIADRLGQPEPSDPYFFVGPDPWRWEFDPASSQLRRTTRETLEEWIETGTRLLSLRAPELVAEFAGGEQWLRGPVDLSDQATGPASRELEQAMSYVLAGLSAQRDLIVRALAPEPSTSAPLLLVPDTNALLKNPALETWATHERATLVLVPQVVRELDHHKQHHSNEDVQRKAQKLIRMFEEYGRRGDTFAGVRLAGPLHFMEIPRDAPVKDSLPWLRPEHPDDQILASALDVALRNPWLSVTLVTEDRGLRNKARQARLTIDSTPETHHQAQTPRTRPRAVPVIRVKSVRVERVQRKLAPLFETLGEVDALVVTIVNASSVAAFDVTAHVRFHADTTGSYQSLGTIDAPAIEAQGAYEEQFVSFNPPWRGGHVTARSVTIQGTYRDEDGNEGTIA